MKSRRMSVVGAVIAAGLLCGSQTAPLHATEALPYGHEIFQAYEKGKPQEAQALLCEVIRENCQVALQPITKDTSRIDLETRLGIGLTANVAVHAMTLHGKHAAKVPVSSEVIAELQTLLATVDQVIANASERARTDERLRKIVDFATTQQEKLLGVTLDIMNAQGMHAQLQATLAANRKFMERRKIDSARWEASKSKEGGAQPPSAGDVLKAAPEK